AEGRDQQQDEGDGADQDVERDATREKEDVVAAGLVINAAGEVGEVAEDAAEGTLGGGEGCGPNVITEMAAGHRSAGRLRPRGGLGRAGGEDHPRSARPSVRSFDTSVMTTSESVPEARPSLSA